MPIFETPDAEFVRDQLRIYADKLVKSYNMLQRLINNITIQSEYAKALRVHIWGGTVDTVSTVSSYAGLTGEGASDRYFLVKHVLQPALTDLRRIRLSTRSIERVARPNAGLKVSANLSVARDNASLISEWGLAGKAPFYSLTVLDTGTGNYTLRFYFPAGGYVEFSSNELVEGWVFECVFSDLRMTNTAQSGVLGPVFFIDWYEG